MTEREVRIINGKEVALYRHKELDSYLFAEDAVDLLLKSFEEVEQYRAIGTVEEIKEALSVADIQADKLNAYKRLGTLEKVREAVERKLTDDEIDCFNAYISYNDMPIAFGNTDWVHVYSKIVGDKISDYAKLNMDE